MSKSKKKIIGICLVSSLAAGGGFFWWRSHAGAKKVAPPVTATAHAGAMRVLVTSNGAVEPEYTVEIKSLASGAVEKVTVQEGDLVKKGQLLLKIDPVVESRKVTEALAEVQQAGASVRTATAKRAYADAATKRDEALLQKGLVSRDSVEAQRKDYAVTAGEVQNASAGLIKAREFYEEARQRLSDTQIKSPIDGVVLERTVQPGMLVASGTQTVSGGTTLLKIADLAKMFVRVKVDEADVAKVQAGQPVKITADALPGKTFGGKVLRVAVQGKVESNVTSFDVLVQADEAGRKELRPAMTANVEIQVASHENAVLVPQKAVRQGPDGQKRVIVGGEQRPVQTGLSDGKEIEILSGVAVGEQVTMEAARPAGGNGQRPQNGQNGQNGQSSQATLRNMRTAMGGGR